MSYADIEMKVIRWGEARQITTNGTMSGQARKTVEEAGELLEAATAIETINNAMRLQDYADMETNQMLEDLRIMWKHKYKDAAGDTLVTLIMGCAIADINLVECLYQAYEEIKDRKGFLRSDGVFIKEE